MATPKGGISAAKQGIMRLPPITAQRGEHPAANRAQSRGEAERLLEKMLKEGAQHLYISDRIKSLPETKALLSAQPPVNAELLLILSALICATAKASDKTVHQKAAGKARELIPGLKAWTAPRSDWLGSGVERVPLWLTPLLLHRRAEWSDESMATALKACHVFRTTPTLAWQRPLIQTFVAHVDAYAKRNGLGPKTTAELLKVRTKLDKFVLTENSRLATWAKKQSRRLDRILARVCR